MDQKLDQVLFMVNSILKSKNVNESAQEDEVWTSYVFFWSRDMKWPMNLCAICSAGCDFLKNIIQWTNIFFML